MLLQSRTLARGFFCFSRHECCCCGQHPREKGGRREGTWVPVFPCRCHGLFSFTFSSLERFQASTRFQSFTQMSTGDMFLIYALSTDPTIDQRVLSLLRSSLLLLTLSPLIYTSDLTHPDVNNHLCYLKSLQSV